MDTANFLRRIWPATGHYCLMLVTPRGLRHRWFQDIDEAAKTAHQQDEMRNTVYHACSSFTTTANRKMPNAAFVKSIWLDLDVGEGVNKFPNRLIAATALKTFIAKHTLPTPLIVDSGGGFHCYFAFDEQVEVPRAQGVARLLKSLAIHDQFKIDPSRTADFSSVLRPVGTRNLKYDPPRMVATLNDPPLLQFDVFAQAVLEAAKAVPHGVERRGRPRTIDANAEFAVPSNYPLADAVKVADKCAQIGAMRATLGNLAEPHWYSALQVIHFCKDGDELVHTWSQGHPEYSPEQTAAKIEQIKGFGPTTCAVFAERNPGGCIGCAYRGTITSPIQLGVAFEVAPEPPARAIPVDDDDALESEEFIAPPKPFKRTPQGIAFTNADGIEALIYPYDLYVHEIAFDDAKQFEVTVCRHWLPQEGWCEFTFRSSDVGNDREFEKTMRDNHVKPVNTKLLRLYFSLYQGEIQQRKKMRQMYSSMGWKNGTECFVLGERAYHADGRCESVGISTTIVKVASGFHTRGALDPWVEATRLLDRPGLECHALLFAAGAGAPLMKFTGFEGALFNTVGPSNTGKTSMARFFTSMYGDFELLKLKQKDTDNAKIGRIGMFASLPVYIDEMTNEDTKKVSDFVYEITQGRSKLRNRIDGTERETFPWNTIVVSSSNASLSDKLGVAKANPEAERLRLFEFKILRQPAFDDQAGDDLYRTLADNYGHAGIEYIKYVTTHQEEVRAGLRATIDGLKRLSGARSQERMWLASVGCAIYGLQIMAKLGLIRFSVSRIAKYAVMEIRKARGEMDSRKSDPIDLLGHYLNKYVDNMLVVKEYKAVRSDKMEYTVERTCRSEVHMRYDTSQGTLWIETRHLRRIISEQQENWSDFVAFLQREHVYIQSDRMTLGKGTHYATSAVECIQIEMGAPVLGNAIMQLVASERVPVPRPVAA